MDAATLVEIVRSDRSLGATELALLALDGVARVLDHGDAASVTELKRQCAELVSQLQQSRPSMAPLVNLLGPVAACGAGFEGSDRRGFIDAVQDCCESVAASTRAAQAGVTDRAAALVHDGDVIMTHSVSSTIKQLCQRLKQDGTAVGFVITESRPGNEGRQLAAFLAELGLPATFITEAQIDLFMPRVRKVMVGADCVLADGSALNKSGTTLMALSARYHGVPFYVCAEPFKQSGSNDYELEQMDAAELGLSLTGIEVSNVYFERVPAELITDWIR